MATQKSRSSKARSSRRWPWLLIALFVVAGFGWWRYGDGLTSNAETGSAYAARVACSCRHVGGRSLDDCAKDKLAGMEMISLSEDTEAKSVTASIPLIASDTATYREGYGCVLQEWEG